MRVNENGCVATLTLKISDSRGQQRENKVSLTLLPTQPVSLSRLAYVIVMEKLCFSHTQYNTESVCVNPTT